MAAPDFLTKLPSPGQFRPEGELQEGCQRAGVYLLLLKDKVVYVGQTLNLLVRLAQHRAEGRKQFDKALFYHVQGAESDRLWIEGALICLYRPPLNKAWHVGFSKGRCWEIGFGRRRGKKA